MAAKQLQFDEGARHALLRGMEKLSKAVKITLGPAGCNVILDKKCRFHLVYLGRDRGRAEPGAGSDALVLCDDRHASRSSAFHHGRRRVHPWISSPSVIQ
jgi:hypothetical protein